MSNITTIGLDLEKSVCQIHGADENGNPVLPKKLRRSQVWRSSPNCHPCSGGMEACSSAHYRARELQNHGQEAQLEN